MNMNQFFAMSDEDRRLIHEISKAGRRKSPRTNDST